MPADYEQQSYWHKRFTSETAYEWLMPSDKFVSLVDAHLQTLSRSARILNVGSGTSDLQNHLRKRGFVNVTNIDHEPLAIDRGQQLERDAFGDVQMCYAIVDATRLEEELAEKNISAPFDLVIDKSTADAVSCAGETPLKQMVCGVRQCVTDDTVWISLSYSQSRFSIDDLPFKVDVIAKVPTPKHMVTEPDIYHWCYRLRPM